jgi:ribonucleoside-diphosphate reductase alpha chain
MYLETRDIGETMDIYSTAWKKGVKTTYYLHMKPRHTAEQSTVRINKAETMGKKGFAAVMNDNFEAKEVVMANAITEPIAAQTVASFLEASAPEITQTVTPAIQETPIVNEVKSGGFSSVSGIIAEKRAEFTPAKPVATPHEHHHEQKPEVRKSVIMAPSDPQADLVCDSCQ